MATGMSPSARNVVLEDKNDMTPLDLPDPGRILVCPHLQENSKALISPNHFGTWTFESPF